MLTMHFTLKLNDNELEQYDWLLPALREIVADYNLSASEPAARGEIKVEMDADDLWDAAIRYEEFKIDIGQYGNTFTVPDRPEIREEA